MFRTHRAAIGWTLVVMMAISPSMVYAQAAAALPGDRPVGEGGAGGASAGPGHP